jgi:hypothetical protein
MLLSPMSALIPQKLQKFRITPLSQKWDVGQAISNPEAHKAGFREDYK